MTGSRLAWEMGLWECLWACVSGGEGTVGGTIPYVGSGLCEKGGEEQHTIISLSFLIADATRCFKLPLAQLPCEDGVYPLFMGIYGL